MKRAWSVLSEKGTTGRGTIASDHERALNEETREKWRDFCEHGALGTSCTAENGSS